MSSRLPRTTSRAQQGSTLVVTLLVFAMGIALVVPMYSEYTLFLQRSANSFAAEQSHAYLLGGESLAAQVLRADREADRHEDDRRDDLSEIWAQETQTYPLDEGGWLRGKLEDLQGRFDLNSLSSGELAAGRGFSSTQEQFMRLLQVFEEPQVSQQAARSITESILDWMDENSEPRDFGAEDDYYYAVVPPYRAANRPFSSVSELRAVAYVTPEIYQAVEPFLTVWSDHTLNINTAPVEILRTFNSPGDLSPLSESEGDILLQLRGEKGGYEDVAAFTTSDVFADKEMAADIAARLGLTSDYFLFTGDVDIAGRITRLYSVLHRDEQAVVALVRASGSL